jgi:SAM-dependent methyltransferase
MLSDKSRNSVIKSALEKCIDPSKSFLDVGSGTGIWAIYAAKLGAARVVAVEMEEALIPMIYKHAQENGVAEKIEIIHGDVNDADLEGRFDVILSELFGRDVYGEATTRSFIRLRERFLAGNGVLLPQRMEMYVVPLRCSRTGSEFPADVPISMSFLQSLRQNYSKILTVDDRRGLDFAAEPKLLTAVDYLAIKEPLPIVPLIAEWNLEDLRKVDAFIGFTVTRYIPEIELNSLGSTTWLLERFDFVPFDVDSGSIRFSLTMDPNNTVWNVTLASHPSIAGQTYSPVFGFTRAMMALAGAPHTKIESPRNDN